MAAAETYTHIEPFEPNSDLVSGTEPRTATMSTRGIDITNDESLSSKGLSKTSALAGSEEHLNTKVEGLGEEPRCYDVVIAGVMFPSNESIESKS